MNELENGFLGACIGGLVTLWGWFFKHLTDKEAHSIMRPEGDERPVTLALCNQRYEEHEKTARKQDESLEALFKTVREVKECQIRIETILKEIKNGKH